MNWNSHSIQLSDLSMLKYGIADYLKKELLFDVKSVPYTFKFDETTTVQTKKQYDGYL